MTTGLNTWDPDDPQEVNLGMEVYKKAEIVDTKKFSSAGKHKAIVVQDQINSLLETIHSDEKNLSRNYITLGRYLHTMREHEYWRVLDYPTFGSYVDSIQEKAAKGRSQLYAYISTVSLLEKFIPNGQLEAIGITKATELSRYVKRSGMAPSQEMIVAAREKDLGELKEVIFEKEHYKPDVEKGTYFDFGGAYFTQGEKEEYLRAFELATKLDPVIPQEAHDSIRRKEVFLRWIREFLATYEAANAAGESF